MIAAPQDRHATTTRPPDARVMVATVTKVKTTPVDIARIRSLAVGDRVALVGTDSRLWNDQVAIRMRA